MSVRLGRYATAAFRDEISRLFNSHRKGDWVSYARKFRLLKERLLWNIGSQCSHQHWFDKIYDKFGQPGNLDRDFETVFQSLQRKTAEIIEPLLDCVRLRYKAAKHETK